MPATIAITNITPYSNSQYQSFRSQLNSNPPEGPRVVPVSFSWLTDGIAPNYAVEINLQNQPQLQFSQICALFVDNTQSDADAFFYFPDTQCRVTVPAGDEALVPVSTSGVRFIAYCPSAGTGDMTWAQIFNYYPSPIAVSKTQYTTPENAVGVAIPTTSSNTTIYTGPGTIRSVLLIAFAVVASAPDTVLVQLKDGTGGAILMAAAFSVTTIPQNFTIVSLSGLDIPFNNGVDLFLSDNGGLITGGAVDVNIYVSHK